MTVPVGRRQARGEEEPHEEAQRRIESAVAAEFALAAFLIGILSGLFSGRDPASTIVIAITAMMLCWPIGWIAARIVVLQLSAPPSDGHPADLPGASSTADSAVGVTDRRPEENPSAGQDLRFRTGP